MSVVRIRGFQGESPKDAPKLLNHPRAQIAQNCDLRSGNIRSWYDLYRVNTPTKVGVKKAIYRWGATAGADDQGVITGVSNTNPVVVTAVGHGRTTGQRVYIANVGGTTEINHLTHTITVLTADTYQLDGVDGTAYGVYTAGGDWVYQNGYWFHWLTDVDVAPAPIAGDTSERIYFTGDGAPKMTDSTVATGGGGTDYPTNDYLLGVPPPATALVATLVDRTGAITGATQANPCVITAVGHGLESDKRTRIEGITGMGELNLGDYVITVVDADHYSLNGVDSTAYGAYVSGGTWTQTYDAADIEDRVYVYTYVSGFSEEGPPSDPSIPVEAGPDQQVDLSAIATGPVGDYNITHKRIYRVNTGNVGADYQLVAEIVVALATYSDLVETGNLGEVLKTTDWDPPPSTMSGLKMTEMGFAVGFDGNEVIISEAYQPHAYPGKYRHTTNYKIVGIGTFGSSVVVCTEGVPTILTGHTPSTLSKRTTKILQSCVSKRGIVGLGEHGVAYPSPDGLVVVGIQGEGIVTEKHMDRDDWQALSPDTILGVLYDNKYYGFYDNGTTQGGFVFDPQDLENGFTLIDTYATAVFQDLKNDVLYLQVGDHIEKWNAATGKKTYIWKSKVHENNRPVTAQAGQVKATSYTNLTFKLYVDGVLKHTEVVTNANPFRMPGGYTATEFEVKVEGVDEVEEITIAETISDIAKV